MYNLIGTGTRESCEFKCQYQALSHLGTFASSRLVGDLKRRRIEGGKRELLLSWHKHTFKLRSPLAYAR